jgi:hypothetical protein
MKILIFTPVKNLYLNSLVAMHQFDIQDPLFGGEFELTWMQYRHNPNVDGRVNVMDAYNAGREVFLAGTWDALMTIENDIIPPRHALVHLVETNAAVAYGLYCYRGAGHTWNAAHHGEHLSASRSLARENWGKIVEVEGYGLGCALIRRHVLEMLKFRISPDDDLHCDSNFSRDVAAGGYRQMCDLDVRCGHVVNRHRIVWPDVEQEKLFRYTFGEQK